MMGVKNRHWSILVACVLFGVGALGYPDDDNLWKKDNDILTAEEDDWFQIDDEDGDLTVVSSGFWDVYIFIFCC